MKTIKQMSFAHMPRDYRGLVTWFMPRAIHDQVDYENTVEVIDVLAGHELTDDQELYLDTLSTLVEAYEEEHHGLGLKKLSAIDALKYLLDANDMSATDLGNLLGERTLGSKILCGQRKIGLTYARILAKRFAVDIGVFLD